MIANQNREILARVTRLEEAREERFPESALLEPAALAKRLGKSRTWVYEHADELGAIRVDPKHKRGKDRRPRLLFDVERVRERLAAKSNGAKPEPSPERKPKPRRRRSRGGIELLPVKGSPNGKAAA
jgi:hypothetical protein